MALETTIRFISVVLSAGLSASRTCSAMLMMDPRPSLRPMRAATRGSLSLRRMNVVKRFRKDYKIEPLAKLQLRAELSALSGKIARRPRASSVGCFRDESPSRIGRGHASTELSIKDVVAYSRQSFPLADGGTRAAHRGAQVGGYDA